MPRARWIGRSVPLSLVCVCVALEGSGVVGRKWRERVLKIKEGNLSRQIVIDNLTVTICALS